MTLDKFGRHIVKHVKTSSNEANTGWIDSSKYIHYNLILYFKSDEVVNGKFVLDSGSPHYVFPLQSALIQDVRCLDTNNYCDDIIVSINDQVISRDTFHNVLIKQNDCISFSINPVINDDVRKKLRLEIIIKCPMKFEDLTVQSEQAYYMHSAEKQGDYEG